jgi:uncharacterized membrane protein
VNGKILWASLHLLFWLSLFPFITEGKCDHHSENVTAVNRNQPWSFILKSLHLIHLLLSPFPERFL